MSANAHLQRLIETSEPLWAGEAEIVRTYWDSPRRTRDSDLLWLRRQAYKEFWDGFFPPLERIQKDLERIDDGIGRGEILDAVGIMRDEFTHYCVFADVYEAVRGEGDPPIRPRTLASEGNWAENTALGRIRAEHRERYGSLGERAQRFTEGGYCTLYSEGMKLRGRGGVDELIADACARVYGDEFEHMLSGIAGIEEASLSDSDWQRLSELTVEQLRQRIRMRNAQFSHPLIEPRIAEIFAGACEGIRFDYERAGLRPPVG